MNTRLASFFLFFLLVISADVEMSSAGAMRLRIPTMGKLGTDDPCQNDEECRDDLDCDDPDGIVCLCHEKQCVHPINIPPAPCWKSEGCQEDENCEDDGDIVCLCHEEQCVDPSYI